MGDLRLTDEERGIFEALAHDRYSRWSRFLFYASVIVPLLAFGVYGTATQDLAALIIGFGGLFFFVLWRLTQEFEHVETYKSASKKIVEHERKGSST